MTWKAKCIALQDDVVLLTDRLAARDQTIKYLQTRVVTAETRLERITALMETAIENCREAAMRVSVYKALYSPMLRTVKRVGVYRP